MGAWLAVAAAVAGAEGRAAVTTGEAYSFGPFMLRMVNHEDPEVRQLAKVVEYNAWRHLACADQWNRQTGLEHVVVQWSVNPTSFKEEQRCRARGSRAFYIWASGNSTPYFPEPFATCLVPECSVAFLREYYVPYVVFGVMAREPDARPTLHTFRQAMRAMRIRVDEIVTFPAEGLPCPDFVVAGFPLSGSTSLAAELGRHPRIAVPHLEDQVFWSSLLTRRALREWARPYQQLAEAKRRALEEVGGRGRVLVGLKEPMMAYHTATMQQLSRLPNLKVIVLVRDPLDMIQSWINHGCDWLNPHGQDLSYWVGLLHRMLETTVFSIFPPERVLLLPTAALSLAPSLALERLLAFLDLPSAPLGDRQPFEERHNMWDSTGCRLLGRCFDPCSAPGGLGQMLEALVRADRRRLGRALGARGWPEELWGLREGRCEEVSPRGPLGEMEAELGLCHFPGLPFEPGKCFSSLAQCSRCCDGLEADCATRSSRWRRCCAWRQSRLLLQLQDGVRGAVCSRAAGTSLPCCTGRGSSRYLNVP